MTQKNPLHCFIDVETTGLSKSVAVIHQIAAIIVDDNGGENEFSISFCPDEKALAYAEAGALEKCNITIDDLRNRKVDEEEAWDKFVAFLQVHVNKYDKTDKLLFTAYNAPFDTDFVRAWFERMGGEYFGSYFWNPSLCVMQRAAWFVRRGRPAMPNFQLGTVCECAGLGWSEDSAHDALYDVKKTIELNTYLNQFEGE